MLREGGVAEAAEAGEGGRELLQAGGKEIVRIAESGENGRDDDGNSSLSVTGVSMRGASDSHELKC